MCSVHSSLNSYKFSIVTERAIASQVLVMMVVSMNCSFKVPLGYFFVNGLPAANKAELINKALVILDSIGINKVNHVRWLGV